MSLPVITNANSPTPADHVKLYITSVDPSRYGDKVVLIDLSHDFQMMDHLHDVLAQSFVGVTTHRIKLSIPGEMTSPVSATDLISDVIDRITPVDGVHHLTMVVEESAPRVYSSNPFEMRKEWDMYRPIYKTSDSW